MVLIHDNILVKIIYQLINIFLIKSRLAVFFFPNEFYLPHHEFIMYSYKNDKKKTSKYLLLRYISHKLVAILDAPILRCLGWPLAKLAWDFTLFSKYKM